MINVLEKAREELRKKGYYTDNIWNVNDVMDKYDCTEEQAYKVLSDTMKNESTYNHIWDTMEIIADNMNISKKLT